MSLAELDRGRADYLPPEVLFNGIDTPASRTYYRLMKSLDAARRNGIVDITLYLTLEDFHLLCAGTNLDAAEAARKQLQLTDDTPFIMPDTKPPFSMLVDFGADGRQTPFSVMTDDAFVEFLRQSKP
jgi:hypothetical protein